jgi:nicotinamidase-related amidase
MKVINDVDILTTIGELVDPARTAVIVIDMQNEELAEGGGYAETGADVSRLAAIVPGIQCLLAAARSVNVLVTYAEFVHRNGLGATLMNGPNVYCHRNASWTSDVIEGTWEAQTIDELAPQAGDIVVRKSRASAMYHTRLDDILRTRGIRNLIITGCVTGGCVLMTAVDTMHHGYYPVVVKDCVGSYNRQSHERALAWMEGQFPTFSLDEILEAWNEIRSSRS